MSADSSSAEGRVVDGTGAPGRHADVAITDGVDHRDRRGPRRRPGARRRRPRRHARLRRHPHALRRPGVLGPGAHAVVLARRDVGRRGQLRLLDRAGAARAPRAARPHAAARRGHGARHAVRGRAVGRFETFPQYLDAIERRGTLLNYACYVGHTAVRIFVMGEAGYERAGDRRRDPRHAAGGRRRDGRRRGRLRDVVVADAQRRRGPAGAVTRRRPRRARTRCSSRCATRARASPRCCPARRSRTPTSTTFSARVGRPLTWTALLTVKGYPWHEKIMAANTSGARRGRRGVAAGVVPPARRSR